MTRQDDELGLVRTCPRCLEEWPFDAEFWHMRGSILSAAWPSWCIACCAEYYAARRRERMVIERDGRGRLEVVDEPAEGRCNARLSAGMRCGRRPGHRWGHRSAMAMAAETTRKTARRRAA